MEEDMGNLPISEKEEARYLLEPPAPTIDWEAFNPLERLYASEGEFIGGESEPHLERMVAKQTRLV